MYRIFGHYFPKTLLYLCLIECLIFLLFLNTGAILAGGNISVDAYLPTIPDTVLFITVMLFSMLAMGLYRRDMRERFIQVLLRLMMSLFIGVSILCLYFALSHERLLSHNAHLIGVACAFICIIALRFLWHTCRDIRIKKVLVIGAGIKAGRIEQLRRKSDRTGIKIAGYIDPGGQENRMVNSNRILKRVNGEPFNYAEFITSNGIEEVVIALDEQRNRLPARDIIEIKIRGVHVIEVNTFLERQLGRIDLNTFQPGNFIYSDGFSMNLMKTFSKRLTDVIVSVFLLTATLPLILLTSLAIWIESGFGGTIIYRQTRMGLNNRPFEILKFRSMMENAEQNGGPVWASTDDARVTGVGRIIRKTRLDELPQLINVLKGDMSLVGPRPERPEFTRRLSEHIPFYGLRTYIKPGITGWAQICYPYGASIREAGEKLQYDLYYIKHFNIFLDFLILLQTLTVIFLCKGAR